MAHQKHVCRVLAKNYLTGIRENAIQTLVDMKMMEPKIESDLHEDVLPWLRQKIGKFEKDDGQAEQLAVSIIESGILQAQLNHATTLRLRNERKAKEAADKEQSEKDRVKRRENRALERELRDKRAAKAALRAQINKHIIDKGEVVQNIANSTLLDIYGGYDRTNANKFFGAIGGQL